MISYAVAYIAKVRILKQITTEKTLPFIYTGCRLYRKGKNFRVNHNHQSLVSLPRRAAVYIAKIRIF